MAWGPVDWVWGGHPEPKFKNKCTLFFDFFYLSEIRGDVTMRDGRTNDDDEQLKIELLSQWKLEAEFRKNTPVGYDK